ncbi:MAG: CCA tRNA nucleotidyltransferase [Alphaproteobacteria bacterium]|nr:CCA tRNA nucleotidyltransferase [Alphaproteobacteria bacterium]
MIKISDELQKLWDCLPRTYLVGGVVRDALLNIKSDDIDMATALLPEESISLLRKKGYRVIPTGLSHGTITILLENKEKVELTTFRKDTKSYGRRSEVSFGADVSEDASRRDFTVNALYLTKEGEVLDFFTGLSDLKNGIVRFIGNPYERIKEDCLRILRFFRFYTRFGVGHPDTEALKACAELKNGLDILSAERKKEELFKLLSLPIVQKGLIPMIDTGVLQKLIPVNREDLLGIDEIPPVPILRLWFLCRSEKTGLKLSNKEKTFLTKMTKANALPLNTVFHHQKTAFLFGFDVYTGLCAVLGIKPLISEAPVFPITASDMIDVFALKGEQIGIFLKKAKEIWIEKGFPLKKELVLNSLRDIIDTKGDL